MHKGIQRWKFCSVEPFTLIIAYFQGILYGLVLIGLLGGVVYLQSLIHKDNNFEVRPSLTFFGDLRDHFINFGSHVISLAVVIVLVFTVLIHLAFNILLILGLQSRKPIFIMVYFMFGFIVNSGGILATIMLFICGYFTYAIASAIAFAIYTVILALIWITLRRIETYEESPVNAVLEIVHDKSQPSTSVYNDFSSWWWGPKKNKNENSDTY